MPTCLSFAGDFALATADSMPSVTKTSCDFPFGTFTGGEWVRTTMGMAFPGCMSLQPLMKNLGAVQSVILKEVTPDGVDVYTVRFANGTAECGLSLQDDGIISGAGISNIEK